MVKDWRHNYPRKLSLQKKILYFLIGKRKLVKRHDEIGKKFPLCRIGPNVSIKGFVEIGNFTLIGGRGYIETLGKDRINEPGVIVGKYCTVADGLWISTVGHPSRRASHRPFEVDFGWSESHDMPKYQSEGSKNQIEIGNDVWIGRNVTIIRNAKIGNGVVIGAGAIVTKDVPSYHLVVGNPGVVKEKRFSDTIINQLEEIRWWEWGIEKIGRNREFFYLDLVDNPEINLWDHIVD